MATEFGISQEGTLIGFINAKNKKEALKKATNLPMYDFQAKKTTIWERHYTPKLYLRKPKQRHIRTSKKGKKFFAGKGIEIGRKSIKRGSPITTKYAKKDIEWTADKILDGISSEEDLIRIASKQKKEMGEFSDVYALA